MSLSSKAMSLLADYGLTMDQIIAVASANERASGDEQRSGAAVRQARYRAKKTAETVTQPITRYVTHEVETQAETVTRDVTNHNGVTSPRARREDNLLTTEEPCSAVAAAEARETDDWPDDPRKAIFDRIASPHIDPTKTPGLHITLGELAAWRREGASWEHDVIPVVSGLATKLRKPLTTWRYFTPAILETMAANRRALTLPEAPHERPHHHHPTAADRRRADTDARRNGWAQAVAERSGGNAFEDDGRPSDAEGNGAGHLRLAHASAAG